ncbi:iron-containing alcohol dehydrogenase [Vibrio cholerae]|nr:iron-containing alcohol dehydrogenase [Vibrio cholerae]
MATQFGEHGMAKEAAVDAVLQQLTAHGMHKLGEQGTIDLQESRKILENALY